MHWLQLTTGNQRSVLILPFVSPADARCLCFLHLLLCPGPQRSASWMPSASWRQCWASASSSHSSASLRPCPSYLLPARSLRGASSQQSCLKREAKCCSKGSGQQWTAEHSWSVCVRVCLTTSARPSLSSAARHAPTEQTATPQLKPRTLWNGSFQAN